MIATFGGYVIEMHAFGYKPFMTHLFAADTAGQVKPAPALVASNVTTIAA